MVESKVEYLDRHELIHRMRFRHDDDFLKEIEATGGWPEGFKFVSFYHDVGENRWCKFTNQHLRTGWWTTVACADDYYWWKISPERKAKELAEARKQLISQLR